MVEFATINFNEYAFNNDDDEHDGLHRSEIVKICTLVFYKRGRERERILLCFLTIITTQHGSQGQNIARNKVRNLFVSGTCQVILHLTYTLIIAFLPYSPTPVAWKVYFLILILFPHAQRTTRAPITFLTLSYAVRHSLVLFPHFGRNRMKIAIKFPRKILAKEIK